MLRIVKMVRPLARAEVVRVWRTAVLRRDEAYMKQWRDPRRRVRIAKVKWLERSDG